MATVKRYIFKNPPGRKLERMPAQPLVCIARLLRIDAHRSQRVDCPDYMIKSTGWSRGANHSTNRMAGGT
jgi:hypothetical protein